MLERAFRTGYVKTPLPYCNSQGMDLQVTVHIDHCTNELVDIPKTIPYQCAVGYEKLRAPYAPGKLDIYVTQNKSLCNSVIAPKHKISKRGRMVSRNDNSQPPGLHNALMPILPEMLARTLYLACTHGDGLLFCLVYHQPRGSCFGYFGQSY